MKSLPFRLDLPLLGKELVEQAARKRTYLLRILYAGLLFTGFLVYFNRLFSAAGDNAFSVFGRGREMFDFLVKIQFAGICIFLPVMMAGAIAYEKERDS